MQSPSSASRPRRPAALALGLAITLGSGSGLVAGCHGSADATHYHAPPIVPTVHEQEPNDTFLTPQGIGPVHGGDCFQILGHVDFFDVDGFAFVATEDVEVQVELDGHDPFSDLELCVYDPYIGDYTLCLLSPDSNEFGTFTVPAGYEFHLVVSSAFGSSPYDLWVEVFDLGGFVPFAADAGGEGDALGAKVRPVGARADQLGLDGHDAERRRAFDRYRDPAAAAPAPEPEPDAFVLGPVGRFALLPPGLPVIPGDLGLALLEARLARAD